MLHFFRNIRRDLLANSKFFKYMKYGIGEIILVVIGILIAIRVDNWNEDRKDDLRLYETLIALKEEVEYNANFLEYLTNERARVKEEYLTYLDKITCGTEPLHQRAGYELPEWFARRQTFNVPISNTLESTGLINRIRNDSLKYLLISVRSSYSNVNNWENNYFEVIGRFRQYLDKRIPRTIVDQSDGWVNYYPNMMGQGLSSYRESYVDDIEYYNFIANLTGSLHVQIIVGNGLLYRFGKILDLLDDEITNYEH